MNRRAFRAISRFECGAWKIDSLRRTVGKIDNGEVAGSHRSLSDLLEVIALIGRDMQNTIGNERVANRVQKIATDHAPTAMPAFRPRIGKQ